MYVISSGADEFPTLIVPESTRLLGVFVSITKWPVRMSVLQLAGSNEQLRQ